MGLCKPLYGKTKFYKNKIKHIDAKIKKLTAKRNICEEKLKECE